MSVALSIAFTGLCALIADGNGAPGQILLVDAKGIGEVGGVLLPEHAPTLVMSLNDLANPESSGPTRVISGPSGTGQVGLWDLAGSEVRVRAQGGDAGRLQLFRPSPDDTSWPSPPRRADDPSSWRDLRFIANMKTISGEGRIEPALMGNDDSSSIHRLPRSVSARVHLDDGLLQGAVPSQETYREDLFEFKSEGSAETLRQALTDTIEWTLRSEAAAVVIDIAPVGGGPVKRLLLSPSASPHRVFISNLPAENVAHSETLHALSDEEMGALHFGAYYKLLMNEPSRKPTPTLWRSMPNERATGLIHTSYCPPAMFSRQ